MIAAFGWFLGAAASLLLYLAAPHQRLLAHPGPSRRNLVLGCVCAAASLTTLLLSMGPATAVYIWLTVLMIGLTGLPFAALLRRRWRKAH